MATKIKLGNGNWGVKDGGTLAYNDENGVFKAIELASSRASGATYVSQSGLIADAEVGVPRIDWTNGVGELLLEPQRRNICVQSEDFTTSWINLGAGVGSSVVITSNYGTSPDGTQNSTRIQCDLNGGVTSSDQSIIYLIPTAANVDYTNSIYIKGSAGQNVYFGRDLSTNVIAVTTGEWQRVTLTYTNTPIIAIGTRGSTGSDDTLDIEIWGAQIEDESSGVGADYPTSYIRTEGSAVTRIADAVTGNSSLGQVINSSEGVLYLEVSTKDTSVVPVITISDGTITNVIEFAFFGTNQYNIIHRSSLGNTTYASSVVDAETFNKFAFAYNNSTLKTYLNGVNVDSRAVSGALNGLDALKLSFVNNTLPFYGKIKDLRVYDTALSDSELQALTS